LIISSSKLDKYKKKPRGNKLSNEEFLRDLEAGEYPDPPHEDDKPLTSMTGD